MGEWVHEQKLCDSRKSAEGKMIVSVYAKKLHTDILNRQNRQNAALRKIPI